MSQTSAPHAHDIAQQLADQLLEAQVAFIKERLTGADATQYFAQLIDFSLNHASSIRLQDAVTAEQVKEVVRVYAFDLNLGGGIMELIGATAQKVYTEATAQAPSLAEIFGTDHIEQWVDKILELEQLRQHIIEVIQYHPAARQIAAHMVSRVIKAHMPSWEEQLHHPSSWPKWLKNIPLAKTIGQTIARQEDQVLQAVEQTIGYLLMQQGSQLLQLDNQVLKDIAMDVWQNIQDVPLNQLASGLTALDIEEFFVLIYELWRHLRQTEYIQHLVLLGVDVFFELYGQYPIAELLDDIGISHQHLINDANRFLPPFIHMLNDKGILDQLIRMQVAEFYHHNNTLAIIQQHLNQG